MDFSNKEIYNYIDNHSSDESDILYELRRETELKCLNPIMLSGKIQGNFLAIISKLIKPINVLEIGTYTGYSTLCIAEGLNPAGIIHTIDKNEELLQIQNKYFEKSGLRNQIKQCDVCQIHFERKKYSTIFKVITCPFKMRELQFLKAVG